jgi:hypothetical protein
LEASSGDLQINYKRRKKPRGTKTQNPNRNNSEKTTWNSEDTNLKAEEKRKRIISVSKSSLSLCVGIQNKPQI